MPAQVIVEFTLEACYCKPIFRAGNCFLQVSPASEVIILPTVFYVLLLLQSNFK